MNSFLTSEHFINLNSAMVSMPDGNVKVLKEHFVGTEIFSLSFNFMNEEVWAIVCALHDEIFPSGRLVLGNGYAVGFKD